jgi:hypothetical protein
MTAALASHLLAFAATLAVLSSPRATGGRPLWALVVVLALRGLLLVLRLRRSRR